MDKAAGGREQGESARVREAMLADGRVQGVGFRWYARGLAGKLGLQGFVSTVMGSRDHDEGDYGTAIPLFGGKQPEGFEKYVYSFVSVFIASSDPEEYRIFRKLFSAHRGSDRNQFFAACSELLRIFLVG